MNKMIGDLAFLLDTGALSRLTLEIPQALLTEEYLSSFPALLSFSHLRQFPELFYTTEHVLQEKMRLIQKARGTTRKPGQNHTPRQVYDDDQLKQFLAIKEALACNLSHQVVLPATALIYRVAVLNESLNFEYPQGKSPETRQKLSELMRILDDMNIKELYNIGTEDFDAYSSFYRSEGRLGHPSTIKVRSWDDIAHTLRVDCFEKDAPLSVHEVDEEENPPLALEKRIFDWFRHTPRSVISAEPSEECLYISNLTSKAIAHAVCSGNVDLLVRKQAHELQEIAKLHYSKLLHSISYQGNSIAIPDESSRIIQRQTELTLGFILRDFEAEMHVGFSDEMVARIVLQRYEPKTITDVELVYCAHYKLSQPRVALISGDNDIRQLNIYINALKKLRGEDTKERRVVCGIISKTTGLIGY